MLSPVLVCTKFDTDGVTCLVTAWVNQAAGVLPSLSATDGQRIGFAVMVACALIWAAKFPRRG